jgi:protoporphyrinogen oxidase
VKVGILGAGITGLSVGAHLQYDYDILEREDVVAGHCRSYCDQGFTFDIGGAHIIFSRNQQILDYMVSLLGENCVRGRRENKIFYAGRYVKYPFENGLFDLPPEERYECLYEFLKNDYPAPNNFKEWMYYTFGRAITEKYLLPYNEKVWNIGADQISLDWVQGRVPKPPVEDVIKAAVGVETEGYTHQLYFYYPKRGGIAALPMALAGLCRNIHLGYTVRKIGRDQDQWIVTDGHSERRYDTLVATLPIHGLVAMLDQVPDEVKSATAALRYNSLITVMLGVDSQSLPDYTAVYLPQREVLFNRISFPATFSRDNVPPGKSAVLAEITTNAGDGTWELTDNELIEHVVSSLNQMGIIKSAWICYKAAVRSKYAYIVNDLGYKENLRRVCEFISSLGIILCGRFAQFEYINMDACVERGIALARCLNEDVAKSKSGITI